MHDFEVGDTVWITGTNASYAKNHYGGYLGPFVIVKLNWNEGEKEWIARLRRPCGPELPTGSFVYRLKHDVFMHAVAKAVKSA